jgi:hypothetical protein
MDRLDLSPRRLARCTRLGGGPAPDRQHLARRPSPTPGSHPDVDVYRILPQLTGERQERLGIDHRMDAGFVNFSRTGAFLNLDQLGSAVGKHLKSDPHRFTAGPMPDSADLASPTPTNEVTHLLPVRLSLPWGGKGDEIFLGYGARCNRFHARLHFIQDDILVLRFLRTNGRRLATLISLAGSERSIVT